jgi:hypothetical protein
MTNEVPKKGFTGIISSASPFPASRHFLTSPHMIIGITAQSFFTRGVVHPTSLSITLADNTRGEKFFLEQGVLTNFLGWRYSSLQGFYSISSLVRPTC